MAARTKPVGPHPAAFRHPHVPIRTCVGCRRRVAKSELRRVANEGGTVVVDARARGRGAYICPDERCLTQALRQQAAPLARALRLRPGRVGIDEETLAAAIAAVAHDDPRREE